jgi:ankyrin repeat protein
MDLNAQLITAAVEGRAEACWGLLEAGADADTRAGAKELTALHIASLSGHNEVCRKLLAAGADVNATDVNQCTALYFASQNGHSEICNTLIEACADANLCDARQATALHLAAQEGRTQVCQILLGAGVDIHARDGEHRTPLLHAVRRGQIDTVRVLVDAGANGNNIHSDPVSYSQTDLHVATLRGSARLCSVLIAGGAKVDAVDADHQTPLHFAALLGHVELCARFIANQADVNVRDVKKWTPLHGAVGLAPGQVSPDLELAPQLKCRSSEENSADRAQITAMLIAAGADVDARNDQQNTPLHFAAQHGYAEACSKLIAAGAEANAENIGKFTPLGLALENSEGEIYRMLLAAGADELSADQLDTIGQDTLLHLAAQNELLEFCRRLLEPTASRDVDGRDERHCTPLFHAASRGSVDIIQMLLAAGADVNAGHQPPLQFAVETPLHIAASEGHANSCRALLEGGANVDPLLCGSDHFAKGRGHTPLHFALENKVFTAGTACAQILLAAGANVATRAATGWTVLHTAVRGGNTEACRMMIDAGAELDARDDRQWTAIHLAAQDGHIEVLSMLVDKGAQLDSKVLHLAAQYGHSEICQISIKAGIDVNKAEVLGHFTPLLLAAHSGHIKVCRALLAASAVVDTCDANQNTPLMAAAQNGHGLLCRVLIAAGAGINETNLPGQHTPLHCAAASNQAETTHILINAGAALDARSLNGCTALHVAAAAGADATSKILILAGADSLAVNTAQLDPAMRAHEQGNHTLAVHMEQSDGVRYLRCTGPSLLDHVTLHPPNIAHRTLVWNDTSQTEEEAMLNEMQAQWLGKVAEGCVHARAAQTLQCAFGGGLFKPVLLQIMQFVVGGTEHHLLSCVSNYRVAASVLPPDPQAYNQESNTQLQSRTPRLTLVSFRLAVRAIHISQHKNKGVARACLARLIAICQRAEAEGGCEWLLGLCDFLLQRRC